MVDYTNLKVPDLKKLLSERGLVVSGNKADLIARLQEDDKKAAGGTGEWFSTCHGTTRRVYVQITNGCVLVAGEDEIDWDEDDNKATTAAAAAAVAAGGQGKVANPTAVPNQKVDVDPSTTTDLKVTGGEGAPKAADGAIASSGATTSEPATVPEVPKQDFSIGIQQTDAEKEAERRAARAKRFGITEDEEEKKKLERAKKFGLDGKEQIVKGLDSALPERRPKRGREEKQGGRSAKRQTPDRRTAPYVISRELRDSPIY
jgi:SAP domain-containing ribonucleoprotein